MSARFPVSLVLLALVLAPRAEAQEPAVAWDSLGLAKASDLAFLPGPAPDGSLDTLFAPGSVPGLYHGTESGVWRLAPGADEWENGYHWAPAGVMLLTATASGALLAGAGSGPIRVDRSTDGGRTWARQVIGDVHVRCLYQSTNPALGGAVYACGFGNDDSRVRRSASDGEAGTWEPLGAVGPPGEEAGFIEALAELPPSAALPGGRLVVGVASGVATSDDGGATWAVSELWENFHWWVYSLAVAADASHPYGGTLLAGVGDFFRDVGGVWASEDGGRTWAERVLWPGLSSGDRVAFVVGPDGAVYAGTNDLGAGVNPGDVYRSRDGGRTWEEVSGPGSGWGGFGVEALEVGRDGRLYAATDGGVWRTAEALPVGAEGGAGAGKRGVELTVWPNPSGGAVTVALALERPSSVRVVAYDVLGREVAVLHAGPLGAGEHTFTLDAALPPGLYVVRAVGERLRAARRVTVLR